jgi:hypothetical protein
MKPTTLIIHAKNIGPCKTFFNHKEPESELQPEVIYLLEIVYPPLQPELAPRHLRTASLPM